MSDEFPSRRSSRGSSGRALSTPERQRRTPPSPMNLDKMIPGMNGEFTTDPMSSTTLLATKVRENALLNPQLVHVHKMCLRDFAELESSRTRSTTPNPPALQRPASVGALSTNSRPNSRMSSKQSCGGYSGHSGDISLPLSSGDEVRPLSMSELSRHNRVATDWFRATHAINSSIRSNEETDAMLAAARDRRKLGCPTIVRSRSVSKSAAVNVSEDTTCNEANNAPAMKRTMDPSALWGLKPPVAAVVKEKPPPVPGDRNRSGVAVGQDGENSLRARLGRRHAS